MWRLAQLHTPSYSNPEAVEEATAHMAKVKVCTVQAWAGPSLLCVSLLCEPGVGLLLGPQERGLGVEERQLEGRAGLGESCAFSPLPACVGGLSA